MPSARTATTLIQNIQDTMRGFSSDLIVDEFNDLTGADADYDISQDEAVDMIHSITRVLTHSSPDRLVTFYNDVMGAEMMHVGDDEYLSRSEVPYGFEVEIDGHTQYVSRPFHGLHPFASDEEILRCVGGKLGGVALEIADGTFGHEYTIEPVFDRKESNRMPSQ